MNADRLIRMALRMLLRKGSNAAINRMTGAQGKPHADMTPEERQQAKNARETAKRARQAARLTRRMGKF
ncbi:hypothetical protein [Actibacterium sp. XHP0104]|uniref:hypothetical protein n=1 Tax=Actibacterium sp. XHP0104 TaxID=2984335 RepID=UPI0021E7F10A|nr:hypothetical protein [Actibacterium sp. XHP0104]MCV2881213.1 hypothetical protein [Actibacterium sp. XHP0104]